MKENNKDILVGTFIFFLDMVLFYLLWKNNAAITLAFCIVTIFVLFFWTNKEQKLLFVVGFIFGPIYDLTLVPTGIWTYGNPTLFGVPSWLPFAYGLSVVSIVKITRGLQICFNKHL